MRAWCGRRGGVKVARYREDYRSKQSPRMRENEKKTKDKDYKRGMNACSVVCRGWEGREGGEYPHQVIDLPCKTHFVERGDLISLDSTHDDVYVNICACIHARIHVEVRDFGGGNGGNSGDELWR
jgi:hypothetical protein